MFIIDDSTPADVTHDPQYSRGLVPRDYATHPPEMFSGATEIPIIPRSEWDARIDELEREEASLWHVIRRGNAGQPIPGLDQDGYGYCWAHSTTHAVMIARARMNLPYVPLSAYAVAATIKNFRDEGGWCGESAEFARTRGIPSQALWPQQSMKRANDNPATWEDAKKQLVTEDFIDLTKPVWGQNLTFEQVASCLLTGRPCAVDFWWWSHSVCATRLVRVEAGSYGLEIWNSWGPSFGDNGFATLRGSKAVPNGAIAVNTVKAA